MAVSIEDEFFPDSYDIGDVAGAITICHLDTATQTVSLAQGETGEKPDLVVLDLPAIFNLLNVLKSNINDSGYLNQTLNNGNYLKYGFN